MTAGKEAKRTRGPNRGTPWRRDPAGELSVLRLAVDTTDPVQRRRVEDMFEAAYAVRRAVQRGARNRGSAYWAAHHARAKDPAAARARFGLSREAFERAARGHVDRAPHLRRFVTKAQAMHLADGVWTAFERHLFRDARGKTQGMPHVTRWYDFTRIPGRARSHKRAHKWETFRLHGSLAGHRAAYIGADGRFFQPDHMRPVTPPADSWWSHTGPLAVVFSGLPGGTLVLPVRLPAAPANQPVLDHHLADPSRWHKIDLVRRRDPNADGGWRYEAHLMVLAPRYASPTTHARRADAAVVTRGRRAGIDVNVSNVTVASHDAGRDLAITRVERVADAQRAERDRARRERRRQRSLDRSRRAANPAQYELSARQMAHVRRLAAAGQPAPHLVPMGPRKSRADGRPVQVYKKDHVSASYRRGRGAQTAAAAAAAQARRQRARTIAGTLVRQHGFSLTVEDCDLSAWARQWGRSIAAFTPGVLVAALAAEAEAVAAVAREPGGVRRVPTATTALSQHCPCGARVPKSLGVRVHACPACGLGGDRDAVAAVLAAFVVVTRPGELRSARVDYDASRAAFREPRARQTLRDSLPVSVWGRQDAPSESTASSARDGSSVADPGRTPDLVEVARRTVGMAPRPTPDEPGRCGQTTSDRPRSRTNLIRSGSAPSPPLRDSS